MVFACFIAFILLAMGLYTIRKQLRALARLRSTAHMPSDERAYSRNQAFRRVATSVFLIILAGMLAGAYLAGIEEQAEELGRARVVPDDGPRPPMNDEQKQFARFYGAYWITVLALIFLVITLAMVDIWSTRRYAWRELRRIQAENREMLERDLAMYRQQKINSRMRSN
jgi:UDP-N-acetylmuramyl pentapeptide phosphotransferase/UDP-N-acetylglucosamine-1-phosphate transferase